MIEGLITVVVILGLESFAAGDLINLGFMAKKEVSHE